MGWKDNCQECGGHPNVKGVLLHHKGCTLSTLSSVAGMPLTRFNIGVLQSLTAIQVRTACTQHVMGMMVITPPPRNSIEKHLDLVVARFGDSKIPENIHKGIVDAVKEELDAHG